MASTKLTRTNGTATNGQKMTFSTWFKIGTQTNQQSLLASVTGSGPATDLKIMNAATHNNVFRFECITVEGSTIDLKLNRSLRDPSAYYHLVIAVDTTQTTASNRTKIYINGVQETSFATEQYPAEDANTAVNQTVEHNVGDDVSDSGFFNGYMAEVVFINNAQLAPTSFGEFDEDSGIWKPINVSDLTFGTNGFYLKFKQVGTSQNSSGMGADTSGEDNHFAVNNLTAVDQSTDTCTNNFATLNPSNVPVANKPTFAEGNLKTTSGTTGQAYMGSATIGVASGKWYAEMKVKVIDSMIGGVSANVSEDARDSTYPGQQDDSVGILFASGNKYIDDNGTTHGDAFNANDILMIALDLDNNNVYFGRNGNWFDGSGNADESNPNSALALTAPQYTQDGFYFFSVGDGGGSAAAAAEWNFGSPMYAISSSNADADGHGNFEYAVPSGYFALNTKNLAEHG